jgi:6,7-dimethyl-8-ribityllumazine synthase
MTDQPRVLIVEARFYQDIADELVKGAAQVLEPAGFGYDRIEVPGVFELPAAIKYAVKAMEFHSAPVNYVGFIALGCVIRGETDHYDHICREASRSLMDLTIDHSIAFGFGVLTCETGEQARVRADATGEKNVGGKAATACIRMMEVKKHLRLTQR